MVTGYGLASPWLRLLYIWFNTELRRIKDVIMQSRTDDRRCYSSFRIFRWVNNFAVKQQHFTACCIGLQTSWFFWTLLETLWLFKILCELTKSFEMALFVLSRKRVKWTPTGKSLVSAVVFPTACFTFRICQYILNIFIIVKYRILWHEFHCIWCRYAVGLMHTF